MDTLDQIREQFTRHHIRRVKLGGFDVDGVLRGKYVSLDKFWSAAKSGLGFCDVIFGWDSADQLLDQTRVTGWHTGYPDCPAQIDLSTFRVIPWEPHTACFLLDFEGPDQTPVEVSPRQLAKKLCSRAEQLGFLPSFGIEYEFFIYKESPWAVEEKNYTRPVPLSPGMFGYSWLRTSQSSELVHALLDGLTDFGIPVEGFHTETGPGVFEAAIQHDQALAAADNAALFKTAVKEICHRHGMMASFMAKPSQTLPGCSGHIHQSLLTANKTKNAFFDPSQPHSLSKTAQHYIAGQLALMPALTALVAPNVNSYKRIVDQNWAPNAATWGIENRTCALRAIVGSPKATRIEYRLSGADINPYIAISALLASGLHGVECALEPPPPTSGNAYEASGATAVPHSLREAVEHLRASPEAKALLGETFVDHYLVTRAWEVRASERAVTDWELKRYFELA